MTHAQYRRIPHAGHYGHGKGHDLEEWDVMSTERPEVARNGTDIPCEARYHSGYLDDQRRQHWVFTRIAPLSPGGDVATLVKKQPKRT